MRARRNRLVRGYWSLRDPDCGYSVTILEYGYAVTDEDNMGMTNAEKQRRYRERALKDPDGLLLTRLQVMLSPTADATLKRICERTGQTKRQVIEAAILHFDGYAVTDAG